MHEDAIDQTIGDAEMLAAITPAIEAWCAAQTTRTYDVDYSVAIVLRPKGEDDEDDNATPHVCPGCHAVAEGCAPGCIDDEMRREREEHVAASVNDDGETAA